MFSSPSPSVFGRRPIDTSTQSASSVSSSPPAAGSSVSVAFLPLTVQPVTLVDRRSSMPCFLKILAASLRTSSSMPGSSLSRYSTTVTCAPSLHQTEPSSSPITPPPMTTIFFGTALSSSAPVESTTTCLSLSTSTPGSGATEEPVAMMMFFAVTVSSPTLTVCASWKVAWPFFQSTLFFLNRKATPLVSPSTASRRCACILSRSSLGVTSMPISAIVPLLAALKYSDACSIAFDGMQPTLRQVPPSVSRLSAQAVFRPSWAARIAAT